MTLTSDLQTKRFVTYDWSVCVTISLALLQPSVNGLVQVYFVDGPKWLGHVYKTAPFVSRCLKTRSICRGIEL